MPRKLLPSPDHKRTKIVATIGPASASLEMIRNLVIAGADVFRLNFSHGTHEDHRTAINRIHQISAELGRPHAILGDLSGPKLRLGDVAGGSREIVEDEIIVLTSDPADGTGARFHVNFAGFHNVATAGENILLDDGKMKVVVESISGPDVRCRVFNGGLLKSRKGVNLPDTRLPIPALTDKDRADMAFALEAGVDMLALSFVRSPDDIAMAKAEMERLGRVVPLLAKIEKKEAVALLPEIIGASDGAMVARGDLGIEIPMEQVPALQSRIIRIANRQSKPVITATQILESMMTSPRPTRAEVGDIYNAIMDGTDAVMLSGETAAGQYPVEAVEVMNTVSGEAEKEMKKSGRLAWVDVLSDEPTLTESICQSAVRMAEALKLDLIMVPTETGFTGYNVSRFRPSIPIFACSVNTAAVNRLCLAWGVSSRTMPTLDDTEVSRSETDALVNAVVRTAKHHGIARAGQRALVLGGVPLGKTRHTNYLHVVEIK